MNKCLSYVYIVDKQQIVNKFVVVHFMPNEPSVEMKLLLLGVFLQDEFFTGMCFKAVEKVEHSD